MGHTNRLSRAVVAMVALAFVASACSVDVGDEDGDAAVERAVAPGVEREVDPSAPTPTLIPPPPTDPPPVAEPVIGDLTVPCGAPGDGADVGIDGERIVIGTGNDRGAWVDAADSPEVIATVRALADHCNAVGGLAGRRVVVEEFDAAVVETARAHAAACDRVFAMVGHHYRTAVEHDQSRIDCGLPSFPAASGVAADSEASVSALPAVPSPVATQALAINLFAAPERGDSVVVVGPDTETGRRIRDATVAALSASGLPIALSGEVAYPLTVEPDWDDVVGSARGTGAGTVVLDGSCAAVVVPFIDAAQRRGWAPTVVVGIEGHDPGCVAGAAADGLDMSRLVIQVPFVPAPQGAGADLAPVLSDYGVALTGPTVRVASAFWLWATAVAACGDSVTRECVVAEARSVDEWTAGGLHAPVDAGSSVVAPCVAVLGVDDGRLVRRDGAAGDPLSCDG